MDVNPQAALQMGQRAPALSWRWTIFLVIVTAFFSNVFVAYCFDIVHLVLFGYPSINSSIWSLASGGLSIVLQTAFLAAFVPSNGCRSKEYFGLQLPKKPRYAIIGITAVIGLLLLRLTFLARTSSPVIMPDVLEEYRAAKDAGAFSILFFALVVIYPLGEELIFRGFMFRGLENTRIGKTGAIVVTALMWSATHTPYVLSYLFWVFIDGLLLGWIRSRTESVLGTSIAHMGLNLIVLIEASLIVA